MTRRFNQLWKHYSNSAITTAQVITDFLTVYASFWIGYWVYKDFFGIQPHTLYQYNFIALVAASIHIAAFQTTGLYEREISLLNVAELRKIFVAEIWSAVLFLALTFYVRTYSLSRIATTIALFTTLLLVILERLVFYRIHLHFHLKGYSQKKILIYGAGDIGRHLLKRIYQSPALGLAAMGFIDDDKKKVGTSISFREYQRAKGNQVLGSFEDLEEIVRANRVEEIYIAMPSANYDAVKRIIKKCQELKIGFAIVPQSYDLLIEKLKVFEIGGIPILRLRHVKPSWIYLICKRIIDFFVALLLITLFSPFYIVFGILIKLNSKGPVIFKQKRVGYRGKEFTLYKFRTMAADAPKYAETPHSTDDPRITSVGKWIRRSSLDELPQLFNVLRGDMSLVGPRPEMPFIVKEYTELQRERLSVKPGITGVWQISAVRGDPIHANIEYDLFYIEHRSLILDFVILVKTVFGVIRGIGAV